MSDEESQIVDAVEDLEVNDGSDNEEKKVETKAKPKGKKGKPLRGKKAKLAAKKAKATKVKAAEEKEAASESAQVRNEFADVLGDTATGVCEWRTTTGNLISRETSKDVKIDHFSLQSHGKVLITDTLIEFTIGRRYGLIGSNGCGKSTFLKALANREVPIPAHIDIFLLDCEAEPSDLNAVSWVIVELQNTQKKLELLIEKIIEIEGPDSEKLEMIYERLDRIDGATMESKASELLYGLGFSVDMMAKPTKDMSGGWRMRVALAKALFIKPTLLLLDEPTNHLDLQACVWLEEYLSTYPTCLVVVSHSQDFLNGVCTNITHITPKMKLMSYSGNYDVYVQTRKENEIQQMKIYEKEQDDIKHLKHFIASCGTFSNLVRQAKSKQKILDKMEEAGLTPKVEPEKRLNFRFQSCEQLAPPVLMFNDVGFSYDGNMKNALYKDCTFGVDLDTRMALVGPNGVGKSTLLKLMLGDLEPLEGTVRRHSHLTIARYHQHSEEILIGDMTPLNFMAHYYLDKVKKEEEEWRAHLGRYGISGKLQKQNINTLSDGICTRIIFAMIALERPHMLLLDEPTNHLDMECIDSLADAINAFEGGLVLVSHDFRLIDQVAKEIWVCDKKTVRPWQGGIRGYKKSLIAEMKQNSFKPK